jgi:hypothetical protein
MNIEIRYGVWGAPLWHVSADPGQSWRLKISRIQDASMAFENIDGSGEGQAPIPYDPGTYWFFLNTSAGIPVTKISYTVAAPNTPPLPTPPQFPEKPGEPLPLPKGENNLGPISEVCDLLGQGSHGNFFYNFRNRYTGQQDSWHRDMQETRERGQRNSICQGKAPPTAKDWQDGIQKQVTAGFDALSKYVTDGLKTVTESWQNGILDLEARMKDWIKEMVLVLLLENLNAAAKAYRSRK